ncbi:transforming growth factor beta receptor type 3 isoform X3 [Anolis carolinensis]|uniref:transforming growth factor beta receptor type 3 isoform X3 n=1 Tax=Anolis carolinensis TaxID=28377 RepID=UPI002F2B6FBD
MCGNCQQRGHLWRCNLLLFFLWSCSVAEAWPHPTCLPLSASTPQPVQGFWELVRQGTGCSSRERSSTGQEVHIVSLRSGMPTNAQVILVLSPEPKDGAPIFVLQSQEPVLWMLSSPPRKKWTFQVSLGSGVSAPEPGAFVEETSFPKTPRGLLKWTRREHGGVTSLAEYHGVNTVYILGNDGAAPATCKLHRNFLSSLHFASDRQRQPLQVCLNSHPPQDLEVHIIFSKGLAPRSSLAHLTVELHGVQRSPHQGLLLILKSQGAAQWRVQAHHLTGQLHILASHEVIVSSTEAEPSLIVTQEISSELAFIGDPLQYAAEQKLPAFISYTEAERVNRFLLVVGMNEATAAVPADSMLFWPLLLPPSKLSVQRQLFPEAAIAAREGRPEISEEGRSAIPQRHISKTEGLESTLHPTAEQKPFHEKRGPKRVSFTSSPPTQTSSSEATMSFQDLPFSHGNVLLNLDVYSSESFAKQPGPCTVSANSRVFVECPSEKEVCKGEVELASGRFQRTVTKPIIVTVDTPLRAATPYLRQDNFLPNQQGKPRKNVQPIPTTAVPRLELPAVVGIAFSAFIIGLSLTGGLWFIHSQTGPEEKAIPKAPEVSSALNAADPAYGSMP